MNSLPPETSVTGSSRERRTVLQLNYSASMEQVSAVIGSSEYCEQHVTYACRSSRLLNTPGKDASIRGSHSTDLCMCDDLGESRFGLLT